MNPCMEGICFCRYAMLFELVTNGKPIINVNSIDASMYVNIDMIASSDSKSPLGAL